MTSVKRKDKESFEGFLRRFKQYLKNSKTVNIVKSRQYLFDEPSREMRKKNAVAREKIKSKNEYLRKIGEITDEK